MRSPSLFVFVWPAAGQPIISLRGVTKTYGEGATAFLALKGKDYATVQKGGGGLMVVIDVKP